MRAAILSDMTGLACAAATLRALQGLHWQVTSFSRHLAAPASSLASAPQAPALRVRLAALDQRCAQRFRFVCELRGQRVFPTVSDPRLAPA